MRATGVLMRFLSLLDVAIILLGILLLAMAHAQVRSTKKQVSGGNAVQAATSGRFVYLYAGTSGDENGRAFLLRPDGGKGGEIATDRPDDLQRLLKETAPAKDAGNRVVLLVISPLGFDTRWPPSRLAAMEKAWGLKIVPLYDVKLDPR